MNEMKLTPKQKLVLEGLADILARHNYKKVPVSDIHCNLTAVKKIVAPNWFDRTFNKLEELGLVEKENMDFIVPGGYRKGVVEKTYTYNITELGLEYLGMTIDDIPVTVDEVEEQETIRPQLLEMSTKSTGIRLAVINSILDQGDTDSELINYIDNVLLHGCVEGAVPDLIYYKDTKEFFKQYCEEIAELLDSYYQEFKTLPVDEITPNALSWWSYEYVLDDIAQKLDISNVDSKVL